MPYIERDMMEMWIQPNDTGNDTDEQGQRPKTVLFLAKKKPQTMSFKEKKNVFS